MKIIFRLVVLIGVGFFNQSSEASLILNEDIQEKVREFQVVNEKYLKPLVVDFWNQEFPHYHLHLAAKQAIQQIDNQEMLDFLASQGTHVDPENIDQLITPETLIAYLRYKKIGDEATYAWIDLYKGSPSFIGAVLDWQTIQRFCGFEFIPAYYLLVNAKLTSKKDGEAWADIFKITYTSLDQNNTDKKNLLLFCLLPRVWSELKGIDPPLIERFDFLKSELEEQDDLTTPHGRLLAFYAFSANFSADDFSEAATYAKLLLPKETSLYFCFLSQALGKDLLAAQATFSEIKKLDSISEAELESYQLMLNELKKMLESNQELEPTSLDAD